MPINRRTLLLLLTLATLLIQIPVTTAQDKDQEKDQEVESIPAVLKGVRANAVEGKVAGTEVRDQFSGLARGKVVDV